MQISEFVTAPFLTEQALLSKKELPRINQMKKINSNPSQLVAL